MRYTVGINVLDFSIFDIWPLGEWDKGAFGPTFFINTGIANFDAIHLQMFFEVSRVFRVFSRDWFNICDTLAIFYFS